MSDPEHEVDVEHGEWLRASLRLVHESEDVAEACAAVRLRVIAGVAAEPRDRHDVASRRPFRQRRMPRMGAYACVFVTAIGGTTAVAATDTAAGRVIRWAAHATIQRVPEPLRSLGAPSATETTYGGSNPDRRGSTAGWLGPVDGTSGIVAWARAANERLVVATETSTPTSEGLPEDPNAVDEWAGDGTVVDADTPLDDASVNDGSSDPAPVDDGGDTVEMDVPVEDPGPDPPVDGAEPEPEVPVADDTSIMTDLGTEPPPETAPTE